MSTHINVDRLNENQREIYQYIHVKRHTVEQAAVYFGKSEGIIQAQITRCRTKGVQVDIPGETLLSGPRHAHSGRPQSSTTPTSNQSVINEALKSGPAEYDVERLVQDAQSQPGFHDLMREIHPTIMIGATIQFMKLCGGRFHAHQVIEDVYAALRVQVGEGRQELVGVTTETKPFGQPLVEKGSPLAKMEALMNEMQRDPRFSSSG